MASFFLLVILSAFSLPAVLSKDNCDILPGKVPTEWVTMAKDCQDKMQEQVQKELVASMTYLAMGSHFSRYDINRPGFAKYFFESASEEREHAIKIISYLLMRTDPVVYIDQLIKDPRPLETTWKDGAKALEDALRLEASVTVNIRDIIEVCERAMGYDDRVFNDYHIVDYLSGDFLEERYQRQRQLVGMISTLKKMRAAQGILGEYLFDKKLLNSEIQF